MGVASDREVSFMHLLISLHSCMSNCKDGSCIPSDEQDIVNQITDFILLHCSSFLIWEFGVGNEIGGHLQLLCEVTDDLRIVARHALWKSILDERDVSTERCSVPDGVTT